VATDAAIGGVTGLVGGPLVKAAFKAAPTVVGGAMALGVATGGKKAYDSYQEGNRWSALAEGGMTATAVLPFANRKSLTGMFGAQARAQTMQTGAQVWNGAKNLGNQAIGGVRNLAASEGLAGVRALGNQAWGGAKNLGTQAVNGVKNWGAQAWSGAKDWGSKTLDRFRKPGNQGSNEGAIRDVSEQEAATVWGAGPGNTAPKAPTSEPDVGLSNRGYQPKPGERSTTKEQWKAQSSEQRAQNTVSKTDQPLENPRANAAQEGHGHSDHGYQTTDTQHGDRIRTRVTPSGRVGKPVSKSSKFNSPQSEAEAAGRGRTALEKDLANGNVVDTYPDPVTGKPTYIDPATGAPTRHTVSVTSNKPNGFGYKIVKQKDAAGNVLRDASNQPLTTADPTPVRNATVAWEYVPSKGEWHIVTHYPN
jgi:hypothetical protein